MKKIALISALALSIPSLFAQDAEGVKDKSTPQVTEGFKKVINDFTNLPKEQRVTFLKRRAEAGVLFKNKRVFEAIEALRENDDIFDKDPQSINLRGACYVELRDFTRAKEQFLKSQEVTGPNLNVTFNIAEVSFVARHFQHSLQEFLVTQKLVPEKNTQMKQLIEFKIFLCHLALSTDKNVGDADKKAHAEKVEKMSKLYDFLDDSPYFYYATASLHFAKGDDKEAQKSLGKVRRIYAKTPELISSWDDTLTEYGFIKNFYGGITEEEAEAVK